MKNIKMITFDLDDTLWDNMPTITKAEFETRKWIEDQVGKVEWGDFNDFIKIREELIKNDPSVQWDISKLRKEIFRIKLLHIEPESYRNRIVKNAFDLFMLKRHEIELFDDVEVVIKDLSKKLSSNCKFSAELTNHLIFLVFLNFFFPAFIMFLFGSTL